jgi:hypothetical protein
MNRAADMTSLERRMPSPHVLQAALRKITETLANELAHPTDSVPEWSELEWRVARAVAAMHGVSPLLSSTLRWEGPPAWVQFLEEQRAHTLGRHARIVALLRLIDTRAREEGLAAVALKGAALQAIGLYAGGERPMADLDLLVRSEDLDAAARVLAALGYHDAGTTWKHRSFDPDHGDAHAVFGEHTDNPIKIDLHSKVAERLPLPETNISSLVFPQRLVPGVNGYPSLAALMLHVLAHAAGTMVHRGLRLIQLCDIARLTARMTSADWDEFIDYRGRDRQLWWAPAPLLLTAHYFPAAVPPEAIARLEPDCPRLLRKASRRRTLSDVSYSHVFIDPIPGILWTRSVGEMLRYIASRVRPGPEQLSQLSHLARTGPWASEPQWYDQSQARRILRWVTSRPTRTETMQPLRAALETRQ